MTGLGASRTETPLGHDVHKSVNTGRSAAMPVGILYPPISR